jgi:hypothetical protein
VKGGKVTVVSKCRDRMEMGGITLVRKAYEQDGSINDK